MHDFEPSGTIASLAPTLAMMFGIDPPGLASERPLDVVADLQRREFGAPHLERCLVFCPDALGAHIWKACPQHTETVERYAPLRVPLTSVVPPKTPVCFASMFSGAQPEAHGIRQYERPVLQCDTLFDAMARGGKKAAIVAVRDSSVDLIFRGRELDYFSEEYDAQVLARALELVAEDRHDLIVAYQQEYDDLLHETVPLSPECLQAAANHVRSFVMLAEKIQASWSRRRRAIVFAPDHGAHIDPQTGHGTHGEDNADDMHLFHWYGMHAAR